MKVTVYHNVSRDASFGFNTVFCNTTPGDPRGYAKRPAATEDEKHPMVKVFEFDADVEGPEGTLMQDGQSTHLQFLEQQFERFNVGEDEVAQAYRARRLRSLSVGDVVRLGSGYFSVDSCGFSLHAEDELKVLEGAAAVAEVRERYQFRPHETELTVTVPLA